MGHGRNESEQSTSNRKGTMTRKRTVRTVEELKAQMAGDEDLLRPLLQLAVQEFLEAEHPYLILDARYEKVREDGVIRSRAVLVAIGIDWESRRRILGVELAGREKRAIAEILSEAAWQRCYVHFLRNALDHLPPQGRRRLPD